MLSYNPIDRYTLIIYHVSIKLSDAGKGRTRTGGQADRWTGRLDSGNYGPAGVFLVATSNLGMEKSVRKKHYIKT
jgi:hypothetical protein